MPGRSWCLTVLPHIVCSEWDIATFGCYPLWTQSLHTITTCDIRCLLRHFAASLASVRAQTSCTATEAIALRSELFTVAALAEDDSIVLGHCRAVQWLVARRCIYFIIASLSNLEAGFYVIWLLIKSKSHRKETRMLVSVWFRLPNIPPLVSSLTSTPLLFLPNQPNSALSICPANWASTFAAACQREDLPTISLLL